MQPQFEVQPPEGAEGKARVAFLVPLSGQHAEIGQQLLNAAQLALFDLADDDFAMIVEDTAGTPQGARAAAQRAFEQGAQLIVGPLFASSVSAITQEAKFQQINVLAFSNDPSVSAPGIWTLGLSPETQVERIVNYASRQGLRSFAVMAPRDAFGDVIVRSLQEAARVNGAQVVNVVTYTPGSNSYESQVQSLAGGSFDAVMIPAGGTDLLTMAPLFPFYDIDPAQVQYLGTAQWNDPSLGTEPALQGGWFAAPPPASWENFRQRYQQAYGGQPARVASLAYDSMAMAAILAQQNASGGSQPLNSPTSGAATSSGTASGTTVVGGSGVYNQAPRGGGNNPFSFDAITKASGFAGVDGIFRFLPDGTVQRGLAVLELQRNRIDVLEIAPTDFSTPTS
ncbi:MAG: penicillin-binding protein activator [Rhodovibrionaceae bacterium]